MEGMNYPPKISLAAARVNAGMLQETAAIKLHVTAETLRSWEKGITVPGYDKFMALQEEILAALPEEKRPVMDSVQDEINTLLMDEGESAFIEGVTFGVRLMMEVGGGG